MEKLVIKNFLILKDIDIEIKKYNFLLGPQASGKSLVAKILFFIYKIAFIVKKEVLSKNSSKKELQESLNMAFKSHFPEKYWKENQFDIIYTLNDLELSLTNQGDKLIVKFNLAFDRIIDEIFKLPNEIESKSNISELTNPLEMIRNRLDHDDLKEKYFQTRLENNLNLKLFFEKGNAFFIPSSRCLYALIAEKPATYSDIFASDPILKSFGNTYESFKEVYEIIFSENQQDEFRKSLVAKARNILKGKYIFEGKQDFLHVGSQKLSIKHTSSGQQEALPLIIMLMCFSVFNMGRDDRESKQFVFIEEPEAHLFPDAQAEIMSMLSVIGYTTELPLFITTHSPYLLSVLNNYIVGTELIEKGHMTLEQFSEATNGACPISIKDVNAFSISSGVSESLVSEETNLVDSGTLDKASDFINDMFDRIVDFIPQDQSLDSCYEQGSDDVKC